MVYIWSHLWNFRAFQLLILLFKMTHNSNPKVLFSVSKCKRSVICVMEKISFQSGISYRAIGCEFRVNGSIIYIK